jgi:hypothetical protein
MCVYVVNLSYFSLSLSRMDTRGTVMVWIRVNEEGKKPISIHITKDESVSGVVQKARVTIPFTIPVDRVDVCNETGDAVDVGMTVQEVLASGCGCSSQNPLLLNLGEGMLS